jgi:hypothetical protein
MLVDRIAELAAFSLTRMVNSCYGDLVRSFDRVLQSFVLALQRLEPFARCLEISATRNLRSQRSVMSVGILQYPTMSLDLALTAKIPIEAALDRFMASWRSLR